MDNESAYGLTPKRHVEGIIRLTVGQPRNDSVNWINCWVVARGQTSRTLSYSLSFLQSVAWSIRQLYLANDSNDAMCKPLTYFREFFFVEKLSLKGHFQPNSCFWPCFDLVAMICDLLGRIKEQTRTVVRFSTDSDEMSKLTSRKRSQLKRFESGRSRIKKIVDCCSHWKFTTHGRNLLFLNQWWCNLTGSISNTLTSEYGRSWGSGHAEHDGHRYLDFHKLWLQWSQPFIDHYWFVLLGHKENKQCN
jgi:hypothetical protein